VKDIVKIKITYRLERIAEGAKAMVDARMAETMKNRNWEERNMTGHERWILA